MAKNPHYAGYSLVELIVVIGILAALTAIAFPLLYKTFLSSNTVLKAAKQLEADLKTAQYIAIQTGGGDMVQIGPGPGGGLLTRKSVFVVFNSTNSYQT